MEKVKKSLKFLIIELLCIIGLAFFINNTQFFIEVLLIILAILLLLQLYYLVEERLSKKNKDLVKEDVTTIIETAVDTEEDKKYDEKTSMKKELRKDITSEIIKIKQEFQDQSNEIINNYMSNAVQGMVVENNRFTQSEMVNRVNDAVESTYKDLYTHVRNKISQSNEQLVNGIEYKVKDYVSENHEADDLVIDLEINELIDESKKLYDREINYLLKRQQTVVKQEIDGAINKQLQEVRNNIKNNNIDFQSLEKLIKKNTNEVMEEYNKKNETQINKILSNISEEFGELQNNVNYEKVNENLKKDLDELKENYMNSVQKNIDHTLDIVKELSQLGISDFKMIRRAEIKDMFKKALKSCEKEMDIISPSINNHVMFKEGVYDNIKNALKKGVKVKIVYGTEEKKELESIKKTSDKIANNLLEDFQGYKEMFFIKNKIYPGTILICDNKFAILGNFKYLSYEGKINNILDSNDEMAAIVTEEKFIEKLRKDKFNF